MKLSAALPLLGLVATASGSGPECEDETGWHDSYGTAFNCDYYSRGNACEEEGTLYPNFGMNALEACCVCGERGSPGDSPGDSPGGCIDEPGWHDPFGKQYDCEWYSQDEEHCKIFGHHLENFGLTASEACCTCKDVESGPVVTVPKYTFHIDCDITGNEDKEQTSDLVDVWFYDEEMRVLGTGTFYGMECGPGGENVGIYSNTPVDKVRVLIDGNDAILIDDAWLTVDLNTEIHRWDKNDDKGWCMSQDSDDHVTNSWTDFLIAGEDDCEDEYLFDVSADDVIAWPPPLPLYEFHIDCSNPDVYLEHTRDQIIVDFYDEDFIFIDAAIFDGCPSGPVGIPSAVPVEKVKLTISGEDAVLIGSARLTVDSTEITSWEAAAAGNKGWCLSLNSEDYIRNQWQDNIEGDDCEDDYVFDASSNEVYEWPKPLPFYELHVNCDTRNLNEEQTNDLINVYFYDEDFVLLGSSAFTGLDCPTGPEGEAVGIHTTTPVDKVKLSIAGTDATLIDYAWLSVDSEVIFTWDEDGSKGWCLSQDPADYLNNGWGGNILTEDCENEFMFDVARGEVYEWPEPDPLWEFHIDCDMTQAFEEHTNDLIGVWFYDKDGNELGAAEFTGLDCPSNPNGEAVRIRTASEVDRVQTYIYGTDATLIEKAWLTKDKTEIIRWSGPGGMGWCLSLDPDDFINNNWIPFVLDEGCEDDYVFDVTGNDVYAPHY